MSRYILGIDQSTQGTKALLFDESGALVIRCDRAHKQYVDENGYVEHDPEEIYANTLLAVRDAVEKSKIDKNDIATVGISNQRETVMMWDRLTGKPVYNAIVWQCSRAEKICKALEGNELKDLIRQKTGLELSPYFSAPKLQWLFENVDGIAEKINGGSVCAGTMDSWLLFKLCGVHKTDYSNAARTMLFNINTLEWDRQLCEIFKVNPQCLPLVCDSDSVFGTTDFDGFLNKKVPVTAVLGDSNGALFGQQCTKPGMIKATYGTGSSVMMNIGEKPIFADSGVVTSIAYKIGGEVNYVLEGNINYTGYVIGWAKKDLGLIGSVYDAHILPTLASPLDTTYFVPAFTGLGAPYFDSEATAIFTGMTRHTRKAELVKAVVDCIAYQISDVVSAMKSCFPLEIEALRADGGPTENAYLMQFQSDILGIPVEIPSLQELSGMGAAFLAGISAGIYDTKNLFDAVSYEKFESQIDGEARTRLCNGWKNAVLRAQTNIN